MFESRDESRAPPRRGSLLCGRPRGVGTVWLCVRRPAALSGERALNEALFTLGHRHALCLNLNAQGP